ncbi:MAG: hypothetical protein Q7U35_05760 [Methanobacteriaceae archaeon]|nr:hypothetical protein [Methanobacteriaceae archaeon]
MTGKIYKIKSDDNIITIPEKKHSKEINFQKLIIKHPDLIPGDQINFEKPRRWLYVGKEVNFPVLGGSNIRLDILFLDQEGIPTLVELKRSEDNRLKSEVASQIIEYGANILLSMDTRAIRELFEKNNETPINDFLDEDMNEEDFWERVYDNLKAEKIRLLVIADEIPNRLQNILEFLNRNMDSIEILAVEIKQYKQNNESILVSRVIGQSIEALSRKSRKTGGGPTLNKDMFFENLDNNGQHFYQKMFDLIKKEKLDINWGTKGFSVNLSLNGKNVCIFEAFSNLSAQKQHIRSSRGKTDLIKKVKNGNIIVKNHFPKISKINGFEKTNSGYKYQIEKDLDDKYWEQFRNEISNIKNEIINNGLKEY